MPVINDPLTVSRADVKSRIEAAIQGSKMTAAEIVADLAKIANPHADDAVTFSKAAFEQLLSECLRGERANQDVDTMIDELVPHPSQGDDVLFVSEQPPDRRITIHEVPQGGESQE